MATPRASDFVSPEALEQAPAQPEPLGGIAASDFVNVDAAGPQLADFVGLEPRGPDPDPNLASEFVSGLESGSASLVGSMFGVAALAGREFGLESLEQFGIERAEDAFRQAQLLAPTVTSLADVEGVGDFFRFAAGGIGQALPSLTSAVAAGGIGGAIAKKAVERRLRSAVANRMLRNMRRKGFTNEQAVPAIDRALRSEAGRKLLLESASRPAAADLAFQPAITQAFARGAQQAAVAASALPQIGQIDIELQEAGKDAGLTALLGGLAGGALEALPALRLLDKMFPGVDRTVSKSFVRDVAVGTGTQALIEGGTEAMQEMIAISALAYHDPSFDPWSGESRQRVIDSFAIGALVGTVTGAGATAFGEAQTRVRQVPDRVRKAVLPTFDFNNELPGKLPDDFEPADNTFFQEVRSRVNSTVGAAINPILNTVRDQAQRGLDALDVEFNGGMNSEGRKLSDIIREAHNSFVEQHRKDINGLRDFAARSAASLYDQAVEIADPAAREEFLQDGLARVQAQVARLAAALRPRASRATQTGVVQVDAFDRLDELITPEGDQLAIFEEGDVREVQPIRLIFGKDKTGGEVQAEGRNELFMPEKSPNEAIGWQTKERAEAALENIASQYPSVPKSAWVLAQKEDGTWVVEVESADANPLIAEDARLNSGLEEARLSVRGNRDISGSRPRVSIPSLTGRGQTEIDLITLAHAGRDLNQQSVTMRDGLITALVRLFNRGTIDQKTFMRALRTFDEAVPRVPKRPTDFAPVFGFVEEKSAKGFRWLIQRDLGIPPGVLGIRELPDGTFAVGVLPSRQTRNLTDAERQAVLDRLRKIRRSRKLDDNFTLSQTEDPDQPGEARVDVERETFLDPQLGPITTKKELIDTAIDADDSALAAGIPGVQTEKQQAAASARQLPGTTPTTRRPVGIVDEGAGKLRDTFEEVKERAEQLGETVVEKVGEQREKLLSVLAERRERRRAQREEAAKPKPKGTVTVHIDPRHEGQFAKPLQELFTRFAKLLTGAKSTVTILETNTRNKLRVLGDPTVNPRLKEVMRSFEFDAAIADSPASVFYDPETQETFIFVDNLTDVKGDVLGVLIHEMGHVIHYDTWNSLSKKEQDALWDAFMKDREAGRTSGKGLENFRGEAVGLGGPSIPTIYEFREWMADQFVLWTAGRSKPKGALKKFLEAVGAKLREFYDFIQNNPGRFGKLNETYAQFADQVARQAHGLDPPGRKVFFSGEGTAGRDLKLILDPLSSEIEIPDLDELLTVSREELIARRAKAAIDELKRLGFPIDEETEAKMLKETIELLSSDVTVAGIVSVPKKQIKPLKERAAAYPTLVEKVTLFNNWVKAAWKLALAPATSTIRSIGKRVPVANDLADIFGRNIGKPKKSQNYHDRVEIMMGTFKKRFDEITSGMDDAAKEALANRLREMDGTDQKPRTVREKQMRKLFDDMLTYLRDDAGLPVAKVKNYFPRAFNYELLILDEKKVLQHLQTKHGMSLDNAKAFYNSLISPEMRDWAALGRQAPTFRNMRSRTLNDPFFDQYQSNTLDGIVANYISGAVKRAEYNRFLGQKAPKGAERPDRLPLAAWDPKKKLKALYAKASEQGATTEDLRYMAMYIDANLGQLGRDSLIARKGRKGMAALIAYNNMRVLLFTVFASLPDLVGPAIRAGSMRDAFKSVSSNMNELLQKDSTLAEMARTWGIISSETSRHIMTEYVDNHFMPPALRRMNEAFFKYTGLNWYTDLTRKMALATGRDYLKRMAARSTDPNITSRERIKAKAALKELGITKQAIDSWVRRGEPIWNGPSEGTVRDADLIQQAKEFGIKDPEAYIALSKKVKLREKNNEEVRVDPVTGKSFTALELMDQLESEGKDRLGREFSERRGYTPEEISDFEKFVKITSEAMKRDPAGNLQDLDFGVSLSLYERHDQAVAESLVQFVNEAIMRPNASQRPILASHPAAMLIFHLKGYMYAMGEVVALRMARNFQLADTNYQMAAAIAPAIAMIALTAIGLELRELMQYAFTGRTPPSDRQDGWDYTWNLVERSGLLAQGQLAVDGAKADLMFLAGPTIDQVADLVSDPADFSLAKATPVLSQMPSLRQMVE